jgi:hypothetical protein
MRREKLEVVLDELFTTRLSNPLFVGRCVEEVKRRTAHGDSARRIQRLTADINVLRGKRERVIDGFVEGAIGREERDRRLTTIDHDIRVAEDILMREEPTPSMDTAKLIEAFAHLGEWEYWTRDQKRSVLSALVPDIRVSNYQVESLGLNPSLFSNNDTRTGTNSSPPPA